MIALKDVSLTPSKYEFQGVDKIYYGFHDTPFGQALIATTSDGICNLYFLEQIEEQVAKETLSQEWAKAKVIFATEVTQAICNRIFSPTSSDSRTEDIKLFVKGTDFQIQVWQTLLKIPFGSTISYQELAQMIDQPTAVRAVANAVGRNPIGYLIPCHRVIRRTGALGGYRWGLECKKAILNWEKAEMCL